MIAFEVRPTRATGNRSQRILPAMATPFGDPSYRNGPSRSTDCCGPGSAVPPPSTVENAFTWMNSDSAERVPWIRSCTAGWFLRVTAIVIE